MPLLAHASQQHLVPSWWQTLLWKVMNIWVLEPNLEDGSGECRSLGAGLEVFLTILLLLDREHNATSQSEGCALPHQDGL